MANKIITMRNLSIKIIIVFVVLTQCLLIKHVQAKPKSLKEEVHLTDLANLNITNETTKNTKQLEELIKQRKPRFIYLEQWVTLEPQNKNILKLLNKLAKKYDSKFYLVIGKNNWFGTRGVSNVTAALNEYGKYIDGIVLRVEPNKTNIWVKDDSFKIQILNQMLDAYHAIHSETKKRNKQFIAEFPFWLTDFKGPKGNFSQDTCSYSDKIIFLIDNKEILDKIDIKWNNITCQYQINLGRRATNQTDDSLKEIYKKIKDNSAFYYNFNGFIVDSDSPLLQTQEKQVSDNSTP